MFCLRSKLFALFICFILHFAEEYETNTANSKQDKYIINCKRNSSSETLEEALDIFDDKRRLDIRPIIQNIKDMLIVMRCPPPQKSYAAVLKQHNVDPSSFRVLVLEWYADIPKHKLHADHFQGLSIEQLDIYLPSWREPLTYLMPNFSVPLKNLKVFNVNGLVIPSMAIFSNVQEIRWQRGVSQGYFGGCDRLYIVNLIHWEVQTDGWLASCPIFSMQLENMSLLSITHTFRGVTTIRYLTIMHSNLNGLSFEFLKLLPNLKYLVLQDNNIDILPIVDWSLPSLKVLKIIDDQLVDGYPIINIMKLSPNLETLNLTSNPSFMLCRTKLKKYHFLPLRIPSKSVTHLRLKHLLLEETNTSYISCLKPEGLPSLETLKLPNTNPSYIKFQDFLLSHAPLQVYLPKKLSSTFFTNHDYETLSSKNIFNVTMYGLGPINCDCQNGFLTKAIKDKILQAPNARCVEFSEIMKIEDKLLTHISECDKTQCESCTCRRLWSDLSVTAICDYRNATRIPRVQNLSKLIAPYNLIDNLEIEDIPESLTFLDLTGNSISYINKNVTKELFSVKQRHLLLAENTIVCDCKNYDFIQTLQDNHEQIDDYSNLTCFENSNRTIYISSITQEMLCPSPQEILVTDYAAIIISVPIVLVMTVLLAILHNRYGRDIRIYLYARGLCLCCIKEDKLDADKEYDAFISFCYEDDTIVSQEFLPRLEEFGFKVCIHYRDWIPGDVIPAQIVKSVASSRRTIIMLSKNFVNSTWGLMEFQTAHKKALKENILRVIVVVLDDVLDTSDVVDANLREYLCSNTYIRYDDSWFWDRLRYALPQPRNQPTVPSLIPLQPIINTSL